MNGGWNRSLSEMAGRRPVSRSGRTDFHESWSGPKGPSSTLLLRFSFWLPDNPDTRVHPREVATHDPLCLAFFFATHPSLTTVGARVRARLPGGTSSVMVEPAAT